MSAPDAQADLRQEFLKSIPMAHATVDVLLTQMTPEEREALYKRVLGAPQPASDQP
jgi:hypothetical protein